MKKLLFITVLTIISLTSFSQFIKTDVIWDNISNTHREDEHIFQFSYGKNKDIYWYYDVNYNDIFIRKSKIIKGKTLNGERFEGSTYTDSKGFYVNIQHFRDENVIRVSYLESGLILEFFKF